MNCSSYFFTSPKCLNRGEEADEAVEKARELHENFSYLYQEIIHQLNTFDSLEI